MNMCYCQYLLTYRLNFHHHQWLRFIYCIDDCPCYDYAFRSIWFEAATVVAVPPSVEIPAGSVLRSALAGGLSCALSCALLHPVDSIKVFS